MDFNLEYYRAFYYVSKLGSTTLAAKALFLSQPAVSQSVQKLEEEMGCALFTRRHRGMRLTAEGSILYQHVIKAFDQFSEGEKRVHRYNELGEGELNLGATETALYLFVLPKIKSFRNLYPRVHINVTGSSTSETIRLVKEGTVDLAIAMSPFVGEEDLITKKVLDFHDIIIAGPAFAHLKERVISIKELANLPIVCPEKGTSARKHIERWFDSHGVFFDTDYSVRTSMLVIPFVENDLAIGIVPSIFVRLSAGNDKFFELRLEEEIPPRQLYVMYSKEFPASTLQNAFIRHLFNTP